MVLWYSVVPSSTKSQSHSQNYRLMRVIVMTVKLHWKNPRFGIYDISDSVMRLMKSLMIIGNSPAVH